MGLPINSHIPAIEASYVSFGVKVDGGGFVIVNGVPHPVDPWGPLFNLGASLAAYHAAALIGNVETRAAIQKVAIEGATKELGALR